MGGWEDWGATPRRSTALQTTTSWRAEGEGPSKAVDRRIRKGADCCRGSFQNHYGEHYYSAAA